MEPIRKPFGPATVNKATKSQCCHCCASYGETKVTLTCNKNLVFNGEDVEFRGTIDNTAGTEDIASSRIVFEEWLVQVARRAKRSIKNSYELGALQVTVGKGQKSDFTHKAKIPNNINRHTAIGKIIARYYVAHLVTEYGCCSETADASLHLVVQVTNPVVLKTEKIKPPGNWAPNVFPQIKNENLKPFMNNPDEKITYKNLPSGKKPVIAQPLQGQPPVFNPNQMPQYQPIYPKTSYRPSSSPCRARCKGKDILSSQCTLNSP